MQVTDVLSALLGLKGSEGAVQGIAENVAGFADVLQAALAGAGTGSAGDETEANAPSDSAREALAWLASALGLGDASATGEPQPAELAWTALPEALQQRLTQLDALAGMWLTSLIARAASGEGKSPAGTTAGSDLPALPKAVAKVLKQLESAGVVLPESLHTLASLATGVQGSGVTAESSTDPTRAVEGRMRGPVTTAASDDALGESVTTGLRPDASVDPGAEAPRGGSGPFERAHPPRWVPSTEPLQAPAAVPTERMAADAAHAAAAVSDSPGRDSLAAAPARLAGEAVEASTGSAGALSQGRLPTLSSVDSAVQALLRALQRDVGASDDAGVSDISPGVGGQGETVPEQLRVARVVSELVRQVGQMPAPTADASVSATRWLEALRAQFLTGEVAGATSQARAAGLGVPPSAPVGEATGSVGVIRAVAAEASASGTPADRGPSAPGATGPSARVTTPVATEPSAAEMALTTGAAPAQPRGTATTSKDSQAASTAVVAEQAEPVAVTVRTSSGAMASGRVSWQPPSPALGSPVQASGVPPVIRVGTVEFVTSAPVGTPQAAAAIEDPSAIVARVVRAAASGRSQGRASGRFADASASVRGAAQGTVASPQGEAVGGTQSNGAPPVQPVGALQFGTAESTTSRGSDADVAPDTSGAGVDRVELLQQIHDAVSRMRISRRGGEVSLRLKPEHLGDLRVAVSVSDGVVRARIVTESPAVRTALETDVAALRRSLSDSGLVVDSIQVSVGGDGASRFSPQRDRSFYSEVYRSFEPRASSALEAVAPAVGLLAVAGAAAGATSLSVLV